MWLEVLLFTYEKPDEVLQMEHRTGVHKYKKRTFKRVRIIYNTG